MSRAAGKCLSLNLAALIRILADGQWHSGEALASVLGFSRAAIAKQMKHLTPFNIAYEAQKGRGYRLHTAIDLLDQDAVMSNVSAASKKRIRGCDFALSVDSTNQSLMQRVKLGEDVHAAIVVSEHQESGKGRRGRVWRSPFGQNLYFSIAWRFDEGVVGLEGLSLAVGVAICRALQKACTADDDMSGLGLKWPNDILLRNKKLGGVLIEISGDAIGECVAVIGIGLNINMNDGHDIDQAWVSLKKAGFSYSRNRILSHVIDELLSMLPTYHEDGFGRYQREWNELNAYAGQEVDLLSASSRVSGMLRGVDRSGALEIEVNGERRHFIGGELSLRLAK